MVFYVTGPHAGSYLHWGVINVGWTNIAIIGAMVAIFLLVVLLPFPGGRR
jgi:hypothetical protein